MERKLFELRNHVDIFWHLVIVMIIDIFWHHLVINKYLIFFKGGTLRSESTTSLYQIKLVECIHVSHKIFEDQQSIRWSRSSRDKLSKIRGVGWGSLVGVIVRWVITGIDLCGQITTRWRQSPARATTKETRAGEMTAVQMMALSTIKHNLFFWDLNPSPGNLRFPPDKFRFCPIFSRFAEFYSFPLSGFLFYGFPRWKGRGPATTDVTQQHCKSFLTPAT